jgi:serine/threonine protein phosphatase PrpC
VPNFFERLFGKQEKKDQAPPLAEVRDPDATVPLPALSTALPPDAVNAPVANFPKRLTLGIAQDVGHVRDHNEDVLLVFTGELGGLETMPNLGLFVVADGMGGHSLGERASGIAARTVARSILNQILPSLLADPQADTERPLLKDVMESAMTAANSAVVTGVPEGGTTLTCALVLGEHVILSHVGDSRAYIITEETFEQVTRDHSLVQRLKELGQITSDEAAVHPQRSVLYRAVGQGEGLEVDVIQRRLPPGASLLLCSDGLWGLVPDHKILEVVRSAPSPQSACEQLVEAANAAGGPDNITAVMVQLPG